MALSIWYALATTDWSEAVKNHDKMCWFVARKGGQDYWKVRQMALSDLRSACEIIDEMLEKEGPNFPG